MDIVKPARSEPSSSVDGKWAQWRVRRACSARRRAMPATLRRAGGHDGMTPPNARRGDQPDRSGRPARRRGCRICVAETSRVERSAQAMRYPLRMLPMTSMDARRNRHNAVLGVVGNRSKHPSIDSIKPPSVSARKV
ncbi:hypothetical protein [Xanthomonas graminis]|uniref:hypothetical protein n=1 Tax=Xanthomonas graminis TaxID=3390026 RepID=UPI00118770ED|nr:hypothetical protein [Xanthomonas translucens]UKE65216.1 hypothetical protein KM547_16225 [Xanthomonas translucens pv. phlei]UKE72688.1 hypothetical protein KFS85_16885 [Xanthomonas translucens pv. phleipratensis]